MSRKSSRIRQGLAFMRGNMLVLTATRILGQFGRSMAFPYASLYILSLGGEPAQIGFINSLAPLAGLLVFPIGGYITDHAGRVRLIGLAGLFSGLVYLLYVFARSWEVLAVAAFLQGFMAIQFPPQSALIADSLSPQDRGRGIALLNSLGGAPSMLAPYVAGLAIKALDVPVGMRYLYGFLSLAYILSALINIRFLNETSTREGNNLQLGEIWHILKDAYCCIPALLRGLPRPLKALAGVIVLSFVSNAITGPFWIVYAVEHIGLATTEWGLILFIETALRNAVGIPAGMLVDHWGRTRFMVLSLALALFSVPIFILAGGFTSVLVIRMIVALSNAFFLPATAALLADTVPRDMRGRVMAALGRGTVMVGATGGGTGGPGMGFLVTLPVFVASLGAGYLYALSPMMPWVLTAIIFALCLLLSLCCIHDPQQAEI